MNTSVLKIGDKAIIQKKTRRDENEYTSQIQDIKGNTLRISTPMYRSALIRLQEKTRIEVLIYGDGKVYEFDAEVIENIIIDSLYFTDILVLTPVVKVERRYYFRIKTAQDVFIREKNSEQEDYIKAITIDLSGGGLQFSSTHNFENDIEVEMKMEIDEQEILLDGKMLNQSVQEGLDSYKYTVKFLNLDNSIQEMIIGHVFKIQRDNLRK